MILRNRSLGSFMLCIVLAMTSVSAACTFPVEGEFFSRRLNEPEPSRTILIIFNHGYARERATGFKASFPPILQMAQAENDDVVLFAQVRNTVALHSADHSSFIESAVQFFHNQQKIPIENIILAGQSCGGWGSLQAAAFTYPQIGGVMAFAPTCHGKLVNQSTETKLRRYQEISQLARRLRAPTLIFLYEGDSYYELEDWKDFEAAVRQSPQISMVKLNKDKVWKVCPSCLGESHSAAYRREFGQEYFQAYVKPLIESVRAYIRERERKRN